MADRRRGRLRQVVAWSQAVASREGALVQTLTDKERQVRGLDALGLALAPFVDGRMQRAAGERSWLELYLAAESARRGRPYRIDPHDPRALLRIISYARAVFSEIDATKR